MSIKHIMKCSICLGIGIILCGGTAHDESLADVSIKQGVPELTLSVNHINLAANEVLLKLVVKNSGEERIMTLHTRRELIEPPGCVGFRILIRDQDRQLWSRYFYEKRVVILQKEDFIQLEPDESFTVMINIAHAHRLLFSPDEPEIPLSELSQTSGEYTVSVSLRLSEKTLPEEMRNKVWTESMIESNPVTVVIQQPGEAVPKRLQFPDIPKDGVACHCRADCEQTIPDNPCLQLPVEARSQTAIAIDPEWQTAVEHARERAREKIGGKSKPSQPCFCTNSQGEKWVAY